MSRPSPTSLGFVLKGFPRISETFISNEIRLLEQRGFRIHIYSMRHPRESFTHESVKAIRAKVTYLPQSVSYDFPRLLWQNICLFARIPKRYIKTARLWLSRYPQAPKKHTWLKHFLQAGWLVQCSAKREGIHHFHAHFAHTPSSVAMYAASFCDVPFSFFAHAKDIYTQNPIALKEKIDRAKFVVTCTAYNENYLKHIAKNAKKISCVRHGIDLSLFSPKSRPATPTPPFTILTVARLVPKKGLFDVLEALAFLRQKGIEFRYILAGDGPLRAQLLQKAEDLGLAAHVLMTGTITHDAVCQLYEKADAFVLGCRLGDKGDRDGIPNVIAEAMAMGVPVAATRFSGIPELVEHEISGMLSAPEDPQELARNLLRVLTDHQLRAQLIPAARQRVEHMFDNRTLIQTLAEVYEAGGIHPVEYKPAPQLMEAVQH